MNHSPENQAIALAGLAQAITLVDKLATTGYLDPIQFETCVNSLFSMNPNSIDDVYGGIQNIENGFDVLIAVLNKGQSNDKTTHLLTYGLGILHLQKKLSKNSVMLHKIRTGLERAQVQSEHFGPTHENVISNLAEIYTNTVSTFTFRIQVGGEPQYLQQPRIASQIRVLLLAAIRAAILWRQSGGNRWTLFFKRAQLLTAAKKLHKQA